MKEIYIVLQHYVEYRYDEPHKHTCVEGVF